MYEPIRRISVFALVRQPNRSCMEVASMLIVGLGQAVDRWSHLNTDPTPHTLEPTRALAAPHNWFTHY